MKSDFTKFFALLIFCKFLEYYPLCPTLWVHTAQQPYYYISIRGNPIVLLDTLSLNTFLYFFFCRSTLRLESLEDAVVLESEDDLLSDKHGCPAYVSPEILRTNSQYSGRAADMWGLGVMLYTMLVGR